MVEVAAIMMATTIGDAVAIMIIEGMIEGITMTIEEEVVIMEVAAVVIIETTEGMVVEETIEIIDQEIMIVTIVVDVGESRFIVPTLAY
mmetsp:Transcript_2442/g.3736  ORF Transcript_2442/g.3736 Transcript_2442/m.3736 type:complete len:89 (-) Transcript_2442:64-330(-)